VIAAVAIFGDWFRTQAAITGGTPVVEGLVEQFRPMPAVGHSEEHFTVPGVSFAYSDYELRSGFNTTSAHGGPIREGLEVRIHYLGPPTHATIVKLEIRSC